MWRPLIVDSEKYLLKYALLNDVHQLYLTDVVNIWTEELSSHDLAKRCKELNPLIEADKETLIGYVTSLIEGSAQHSAMISLTTDDTKKFDINSKVAEVPFYFSFYMKKCRAEVVCQEVILPLVNLALQLQAEQNYLCKTLGEKDAEIEQYKLEGAVLRKSMRELKYWQLMKKLETKPFTQDELQEVKMNMPQNEHQQLVQLFSPWLCSRLSTNERMLSSSIDQGAPSKPRSADSGRGEQPVALSSATVKQEPGCESDSESQLSLLSEAAAKRNKPTVNKHPKLRL